MTIGQTIAAERRKLGLSQEQLGEKMGVTRQSISEWESDAALPELEKLIALSRLFPGPVGQLLGIEEPAAPDRIRPSSRAGGSAAAGRAHRRGVSPAAAQARRWPRWVSLALIFGLALGLWQTSQRLSNLEQNYPGVCSPPWGHCGAA
ncbi:MAG: helix-turn-helix transcriptional regulator [Acutalibacteraceae bacterium]